jgi:hypothetical protein
MRADGWAVAAVAEASSATAEKRETADPGEELGRLRSGSTVCSAPMARAPEATRPDRSIVVSPEAIERLQGL